MKKKKNEIWHWSTDVKQLKKHKEAYAIWKLEHLINYGLQGRKLSEKQVKKYWDKLHLDPYKERFLELLLWNKKRLLPTNKIYFWTPLEKKTI